MIRGLIDISKYLQMIILNSILCIDIEVGKTLLSFHREKDKLNFREALNKDTLV